MEGRLLRQGTGGRGRELVKKGAHVAFRLGQRVGFDLLPRHFYSAVPDLRALEATTSWRDPSTLAGVRGTDLDEQVAELETWFTEAVVARIRESDPYEHATAANGAIGFGPAEAQMLHAWIATRRPRRVLQIGAGVSTAVIVDTARRHGVDVEVICVDPYPTQMLQRIAAQGAIRLVAEPAQTASIQMLTDLGAGDLLFVDSTHTVKPGSEVNRIILEVLPRLRRGVTVHFHDITFPYDYQRDVLDAAIFFWTESTLLHAFLVDNARVRVLVSGSMLQYAREADLRRVLPRFDPRASVHGLDVPGDLRDFAGSTYLLVDGD